MKLLNKLSCAFTAGVIGAIVLDIVATLIYGMPQHYGDFKAALYKYCIWGGIWALLLAIPILKNRWFIRGSIIGILVILFNYLVLSPVSGHGFFNSQLPLSQALGNLLNYIWGLAAALWFHFADKAIAKNSCDASLDIRTPKAP